MAPSNLVLLATIGAAHGVRGEVRVKSFTEDPLSLGEFGPLHTEDGREFRIERLRPAKEVVVAKFRGVDDRNAAEALKGVSLYVDRELLAPPEEEEEFYHADLIGLAAATPSGEPVGAVIAVHNFGAGDILEIAPSRGPTLLVPFTRQTVPQIDIAGSRIVVAPPAETGDEEPEANEEA